MRGRKLVSKFSLISLACSLLGVASAVTYGPSLVSLTRWDRFTRGPTIFNPDTGRVIALEDYPNYSVVIPLAPENPTASSNQVFISRRVSGPGEFHVVAPPGYGVMAVVQSMDLRVADGICNDFILFSGADGVETTGTCGKVDIRNGNHAPQGLIGPRAFINPSGRMRVLFYHGFIWGLVRNFNFDLLDPSLNPTLRVEIVFTAYKDCSSTNSTSSEDTPNQKLSSKRSNSSDYDNSEFLPCSPSLPNACIHKDLWCDLAVNCAFEKDFGLDEDFMSCDQEELITGFSKSLHSPPTVIVSTLPTSTEATTTTSTTEQSTTPITTTTRITSTTSSTTTTAATPTTTTAKAQARAQNTSQPFVEPRHRQVGSVIDAVGLIGLVHKHPPPRLEIKPKISPVSSKPGAHLVRHNRTEQASKPKAKMPLAPGGELFVDIKADPVEKSLAGGLSKEDFEDEDDSMSPHAIAGILCLVALVLILLGMLRVYYCYNKVIWNPHGNLSSGESPPETPISNMARKMKELAGEGVEVLGEKRKGKEQPPSYEILFPLPEDKVVEDATEETLKV